MGRNNEAKENVQKNVNRHFVDWTKSRHLPSQKSFPRPGQDKKREPRVKHARRMDEKKCQRTFHRLDKTWMLILSEIISSTRTKQGADSEWDIHRKYATKSRRTFCRAGKTTTPISSKIILAPRQKKPQWDKGSKGHFVENTRY